MKKKLLPIILSLLLLAGCSASVCKAVETLTVPTVVSVVESDKSQESEYSFSPEVATLSNSETSTVTDPDEHEEQVPVETTETNNTSLVESTLDLLDSPVSYSTKPDSTSDYDLYENNALVYSGNSYGEMINSISDSSADYVIKLARVDLAGTNEYDQKPVKTFTFSTLPAAASVTIEGCYYESDNYLVNGYFTQLSSIEFDSDFEVTSNLVIVDCEVEFGSMNLHGNTLTTEGTCVYFYGSEISNGTIICNTTYETNFIVPVGLTSVDLSVLQASIYISGNSSTDIQINSLNLCYNINSYALCSFEDYFDTIIINHLNFLGNSEGLIADIRFARVVANDIQIRHIDMITNYGINSWDHAIIWFQSYEDVRPAYVKIGEVDAGVKALLLYSGVGTFTLNPITNDYSESYSGNPDITKCSLLHCDESFLNNIESVQIENENLGRDRLTVINNELYWLAN